MVSTSRLEQIITTTTTHVNCTTSLKLERIVTPIYRQLTLATLTENNHQPFAAASPRPIDLLQQHHNELTSRIIHRWGGRYQIHNTQTLPKFETNWFGSTRNCLVSLKSFYSIIIPETSGSKLYGRTARASALKALFYWIYVNVENVHVHYVRRFAFFILYFFFHRFRRKSHKLAYKWISFVKEKTEF